MPIRIDRIDRIIANIRIEVERLGIGEHGVGHRRRHGRPVGQHPAAGLRLVVARAEVVQAALRVVLLAREVLLGGVQARALGREAVAEC